MSGHPHFLPRSHLARIWPEFVRASHTKKNKIGGKKKGHSKYGRNKVWYVFQKKQDFTESQSLWFDHHTD